MTVSNAAKRSSEISPEKCSLDFVTSGSLGTLARAASGGGEDQGRPTGVRRERGSEEVQMERAGTTILRSLTQRVGAEIGSWRQIRSAEVFFQTREPEWRREGELTMRERERVMGDEAPRAAGRQRASAEQAGPGQLPWPQMRRERD